MEHLMEYSNWVSTSTDPIIKKMDYHYITTHKLLYGTHEIEVAYNGTMIKTNAKFDTGASNSSIDLVLARKLGIEENLIEAYKELEKVQIPKTISKEEKKELEKKYREEFTTRFPGISSVKITKSASGFSIRPYIRLKLIFNGRYIDTEANLKDRSGMSVEMLVGLKDML